MPIAAMNMLWKMEIFPLLGKHEVLTFKFTKYLEGKVVNRKRFIGNVSYGLLYNLLYSAGPA